MSLATSLKAVPRKKTESSDIGRVVGVLVLLLAAALYLVSGVRALTTTGTAYGACLIAASWATAYYAAGFLVGFLFGIPRVLQGNGTDRGTKEPARGGYSQRVNTNLEQISDWLTKIIVGLGLVQLRQLPKNLYDASTWMARSFTPANGDVTQAASFAASIIILFSVSGFIAGYLMTRLFIAGAFRRADTQTTETVNASGVSDDEAQTKLATFWKPDGKKADPEHEKQLLDWMSKHGLITPERRISITLFVNTPDYAQQRAQAVADLGIE